MPPGALTQRLKLFVGAQHLVYALGAGHAQILAGARHARGHRAGSALLAGALRFRAMLSCVSGDHTAKYRDALVAVTDTPGYERLAPFEKLLAFG